MTTAPLFGLLILERDPLTYADFWGLLQTWLQDAGGFAFVGLGVYLVYAIFGGRAVAGFAAGAAATAAVGSATGRAVSSAVGRDEMTNADRDRNPVTGFMLVMAVLAILCYAAYGFMLSRGYGVDPIQPKPYSALGYYKPDPPRFSTARQPLVLMTGGLCSLLGIGQPFAAGLLRLRGRRVWALTRVAFKEAVRNKLFWVFLLFLLPLLFPAKWFAPGKPSDELRATIGYTSFASTFLLLFPAALLAAFSIPNDIKNQNIYTIVTKPVERFEIVLGRFLGYVYLMTLALFGMTAVGWLFIASTSPDEAAKEETYLARMPVRATLSFESRKGTSDGTNVGREFDYRKYIGGSPQTSQRAVYKFRSVPSALARGRDAVPMEYTFDIFRMTKGLENRGVEIEVQVATASNPLVPPPPGTTGPEWRWADIERKVAYTKAAVAKLGLQSDPIVRDWERNGNWDEIYNQRVRPRTRGVGPNDRDWPAVNELAAEFGFYEIAGKEVYDNSAPGKIDVPAGLFENAARAATAPDSPAPVTVYVKCTSPGQMLGMADGDLYFLETDPTPSAWMFAQNYFKASVGLWCRVCLVVGLAVTCSTYLAGVISFLVAGFLFLAGYFSDHLADMASGKSFVGGPFQAISQLLEAKQSTMPLDEANPMTRVAQEGDVVVSWMFRRLINVVPDLDSYTWTQYLAEGFNVPVEYLVMNIVVLVGYLLPWFILGFYLMRSREVAA